MLSKASLQQTKSYSVVFRSAYALSTSSRSWPSSSELSWPSRLHLSSFSPPNRSSCRPLLSSSASLIIVGVLELLVELICFLALSKVQRLLTPVFVLASIAKVLGGVVYSVVVPVLLVKVYIVLMVVFAILILCGTRTTLHMREIEECIERYQYHSNELQRQYRLFNIREKVKGRRTVLPLPHHSMYRFSFGSPQKLKYVSGWDGTEFKIKLLEELVRKLLLKISFLVLLENSQLSVEASALAVYKERNTLSTAFRSWRRSARRRSDKHGDESKPRPSRPAGDEHTKSKNIRASQSTSMSATSRRTWGNWEEIATSSLIKGRDGSAPLTTEEHGGLGGGGYHMYNSGSDQGGGPRDVSASDAQSTAPARPDTRHGAAKRWAGVQSKGPPTRAGPNECQAVAQEKAVLDDDSREKEADPDLEWGPGGVPDFRGTVHGDHGAEWSDSTSRMSDWAGSPGASPEQVDPDKQRMASDIVSVVRSARVSLEAIRARHR
ncbi:hypothetical protein J8273_6226 [Carpediemonas membranifera]|uniref:Uncharacterized protein n=1 Tax=Carpediemonas membranifera TaxID=201153 RepID=A0A8J6E089_9EUKA|nr:hypothetical protein J8273_6226 [Carpediemonas membranifera]|eukprot:KAG9391466.1 hypothetical protein J8273_6226 [Carpediemonas membranifera]